LEAFGLTESAARWATEQAKLRTGGEPPGRGPTFREPTDERLLFRNDSGETIPAYGIVRVTGYVEANGRNMVTVTKPATSVGSFIVNGREEVLANEYGYGFAGPVVRVTYHSSDSPNPGNILGVDGFQARSYSSGQPVLDIVILGVIDSTNRIAFARLVPVQQLMIKAPSGGIPGRVGTMMQGAICDVMVMSSVDQLATSSVQLKVYNWSTSLACANGDRYGIAGLINGKWHIIAEDCNDEGSTTQAGTGSGTGGRIGDAIDTSTVSPVVGIGVGGQVLYSGGTAPIP
jgi:hypothetical protein